MLTSLKSLFEKFFNLIDGAVFIVTKLYIKKIFLAGKNIGEGLATAQRLTDKGYGVTYHIMTENLTDELMVQANLQTNIALVLRADARGLQGNLAVKLSAFGGALSNSKSSEECGATPYLNEEKAKYYLGLLLSRINHIPEIEVEIDAEEYHTLWGAHRVIEELSKTFPGRLRMAVQMHVPDFDKLSTQQGYAQRKIRIVRGAGVYEDVASKNVVSDIVTNERAFDLAWQCIEAGHTPYVGTLTNMPLFERILENLDGSNLRYDAIVLESLYGAIGRKLRRYALRKGVRVVVYTPIVVKWCLDAWEPYCRRRVPMMRKYFWKLFIVGIKKIFS